MKNFLKSSLYLAAFAVAGILFQISCSNSDEASSVQSTAQLNKIIFTKGVSGNQTIWVSNYDGTGLVQIPITLPAGVTFNGTNGNAYPRLSPDGQTIFFVAFNEDSTSSIYSCGISGNNVQEIYTAPDMQPLAIGSVN